MFILIKESFKPKHFKKASILVLLMLFLTFSGCSFNNESNQTASSQVTASSSLAVSTNLNTQDQVTLAAIEFNKLPTKLTYSPNESISTSGGELRLFYSNYDFRIIKMNDNMIDTTRLNISEIGTKPITIKYQEGSIAKYISYNVEIVPFVVNVNSVALDIVSSDVLRTQSVQLNPIIAPTNAYIFDTLWTSSNPLIATVDANGLVTPKNPGTVTISVLVNGKYSASSNLNILAAEIVETTTPAVTVSQVTLTFNTNGGNNISSVVENAADPFPSIANPVRSGYTFTGWNPALPNLVPAVDTTYSAAWTANTYVVTLHNNDGTNTTSTINVTFGSTYGTLPTLTRTGHSGHDWNTLDNGNGVQKDASSIVTTASNHVLYAIWIPNNAITVTFNSNGGTNLSLSTKSVVPALTYGNLATVEKEGNTFAGWYLDNNTFNNPITSSSTVVETSNHSLYAKWTIESYTIAFNLNYSGAPTPPTSITANFNASISAPSNPIRSGHIFDGWYEEVGTTTSFTIPSTMPDIGSSGTTKTLYAKWTIESYTIAFDLNYVGAPTPPTSITANFAASISAPADPARTGYTFGGWYEEAGATNAYSIPSTMPDLGTEATTKTLFAKWTGSTYTITFDKQTGSGGSNLTTATFGSAMHSSLSAPSLAGTTFLGYYTIDNGVYTQYYNGSMVSVKNWDIASDRTLYAVYSFSLNPSDLSNLVNEGATVVTTTLSALSFNETDNVYLNHSHTASNNFTLEAWIRTTSTGKIVGFESVKTGPTSLAYDRMIYIDDNGHAVFGVYTDNNERYAKSTNSINDGTWKHIVATYNENNLNGSMNLYIDGILQATTQTPNSIFDYNGFWRFGSYKLVGWENGVDGFFTGLIGNATVTIGQTLTSSEVTTIFDNYKQNYLNENNAGYQVVTFTTVGTTTWTVPDGITSVEYLVVGGGGGGGNGSFNNGGGGGAAGMVRIGFINTTPGASISVTVGAGGSGGAAGSGSSPVSNNGSSGGNSIFSTITSNGGLFGHANRQPVTLVGDEGSAQNNLTSAKGGYGGRGGGTPPMNSGYGGGGSSTDGKVGKHDTSGGSGGLGLLSKISEQSNIYGVGGNGGYGGGGLGGVDFGSSGNLNGIPGTSNTGNGGAGGSTEAGGFAAGGSGGSGIVIIRYPIRSLVINLDAGNTASYPGTGSTWTNLVNSTQYTINNGTFDSANGGSIVFNGTSTYVSIGTPLSGGTNFTKEAWVNADVVTGSRNILSSASNVFWNNESTLSGGVANQYFQVTSNNFPTTVWRHVVLTFDDVNNTMRLYINGVQVSQNIGVTQSYISETERIGAHFFNGNPVSFWDGKIAQVRVYSVALTGAQVLQNFNETKARYGF